MKIMTMLQRTGMGLGMVLVLASLGQMAMAQGFGGYAQPGYATAGTATAGTVTGAAGQSVLPYTQRANAKRVPLTGTLPVMPGMAAGGSYVVVNHGGFGHAPTVYCPPVAVPQPPVAVQPTPPAQPGGRNPLVYAFPANELNPPQAPLTSQATATSQAGGGVTVAPGQYQAGYISADGRAVGGSAMGGAAYSAY